MRIRRNNQRHIPRRSKNYVLTFTIIVAIITVGYATFAQPLAHKLATILPDDFHYGLWPVAHHDDNKPGARPTGKTKRHENAKKHEESAFSEENSKWDVGFINAEKTIAFGSAHEITPVTFTKLSANFYISLLEPGDLITYTFTVKNMGILDAKVSDIKIVGNDSEDIICKVEGLDIGDELNVGKTKDLTVTIVYKSDAPEIPDTTKENISVTLLYVQK